MGILSHRQGNVKTILSGNRVNFGAQTLGRFHLRQFHEHLTILILAIRIPFHHGNKME